MRCITDLLLLVSVIDAAPLPISTKSRLGGSRPMGFQSTHLPLIDSDFLLPAGADWLESIAARQRLLIAPGCRPSTGATGDGAESELGVEKVEGEVTVRSSRNCPKSTTKRGGGLLVLFNHTIPVTTPSPPSTNGTTEFIYDYSEIDTGTSCLAA